MKLYPKLIIPVSALFLLTFLANPAYAYLDPGTGSMLIQGFLAAVAAVSVSLGIFWRRLRSFFARIVSRKKIDGNDR